MRSDAERQIASPVTGAVLSFPPRHVEHNRGLLTEACRADRGVFAPDGAAFATGLWGRALFVERHRRALAASPPRIFAVIE